ncbi:MAG: hypothetical protein LBR39_01650 [Coriobacteriales bacterium]|jgi:hypothetical protein|nr:hypothetical protein [Coriobacteriales bacterium]
MTRVPLVTYEEATGKVKEAFDYQIGKSGSISNMKRALLNDFDTYDVFMGWYVLWADLLEILSKREAIIFAHAISTTNGCILCSLFFISDLKDLGEDPHDFSTSEREALLQELGSTIVKDLNGVTDDLIARLKQHWNDRELTLLVGFAAQMIATNIFNSVLDVDVDERLTSLIPDFEPVTWRKNNG